MFAQLNNIAAALTKITGHNWKSENWWTYQNPEATYKGDGTRFVLRRTDAPDLAHTAEISVDIEKNNKAEASGITPQQLRGPYAIYVPAIGFTITRAPSALAADINRRLLPGLYDALKKMSQSRRIETRRAEGLEADTNHLRDIATFETRRAPAWNEQSYQRKIYLSEPTRGEITLQRYTKETESTVKIELDKLTLTQAKTILYLLNTWKTS